jgi:hypothetical protein
MRPAKGDDRRNDGGIFTIVGQIANDTAADPKLAGWKPLCHSTRS